MSQYPEYYYTYSPQQYQVQQVQGVVGTVIAVATMVALGAWAFSLARKAVKGEEVKYPL
jgi:hypothetical protein